MILKPNLSARLGPEFKQQGRQVNFYYRASSIFRPLILHELCIKSLFLFYLAHLCWLMSITPHSLFLWHNSLSESFNSAYLKIHLSLYPLLWWVLGNGSAVLEKLHHRAQTQVRWREMCYRSKLPQQDNVSAHYQCCFQTAVYGT